MGTSVSHKQQPDLDLTHFTAFNYPITLSASMDRVAQPV